LVVIPMDTTCQRLRIDKGWMRTLLTDGSIEVDDASFMQLVQEGEPPLLWSTLIYPFKGKTRPEIVVNSLPVSFSPVDKYVFQEDDDIRRAFQINVQGEEHIWFENPQRDDVHQFGTYRSDGTTGLLVIKEGSMKRLFLLNASFLEKNENMLISSDADLSWLTLSISENNLEIYADKKCRMKVLVKGIEAVRFNDKTVPFIQFGGYVLIR
ncbi:MAG: hypothetical protein K8R35_00230, partial [Bacteroidales bacterium]|nr:hypothetical protein [Bacteroidales bacterium]